jgi:hypothetical protein
LDEVYNVYDPVSGKMKLIYCANGQIQENNDIFCWPASFTRNIQVKPDLTPGNIGIGHDEHTYTTPFVKAFVCE